MFYSLYLVRCTYVYIICIRVRDRDAVFHFERIWLCWVNDRDSPNSVHPLGMFVFIIENRTPTTTTVGKLLIFVRVLNFKLPEKQKCLLFIQRNLFVLFQCA